MDRLRNFDRKLTDDPKYQEFLDRLDELVKLLDFESKVHKRVNNLGESSSDARPLVAAYLKMEVPDPEAAVDKEDEAFDLAMALLLDLGDNGGNEVDLHEATLPKSEAIICVINSKLGDFPSILLPRILSAMTVKAVQLAPAPAEAPLNLGTSPAMSVIDNLANDSGEPLTPEQLDQREHLARLEQVRMDFCLEELKKDFDGGIVLIDENGTVETFQAALKADKTAGQEWESIKERLLANGANLLRRAEAMPEGARLIGVYADGSLAIRQRSKDIANAIWQQYWNECDPEHPMAELLLLPHAKAMAMARSNTLAAKTVEIMRAVKSAGYHVPPDLGNKKKKGLVAASEVVTGEHYLMSSDGEGWRNAILECDENVPDDSFVSSVYFKPSSQQTFVHSVKADSRSLDRGAILWLRG